MAIPTLLLRARLYRALSEKMVYQILQIVKLPCQFLQNLSYLTRDHTDFPVAIKKSYLSIAA